MVTLGRLFDWRKFLVVVQAESYIRWLLCVVKTSWCLGTIRRECLDYVILIDERHLLRKIREWTAH